MANNAIVCVGCSASGKSTFAREYAANNKTIISCRDDLRWALSGKTGWKEYGWPFPKEVEQLVTKIQRELTYAVPHDTDIILADTNLNTDVRNVWINRFMAEGFEVEVKYFHVPDINILIERDSKRGIFSVGEEVIRKQFIQMEQIMKEISL